MITLQERARALARAIEEAWLTDARAAADMAVQRGWWSHEHANRWLNTLRIADETSRRAMRDDLSNRVAAKLFGEQMRADEARDIQGWMDTVGLFEISTMPDPAELHLSKGKADGLAIAVCPDITDPRNKRQSDANAGSRLRCGGLTICPGCRNHGLPTLPMLTSTRFGWP